VGRPSSHSKSATPLRCPPKNLRQRRTLPGHFFEPTTMRNKLQRKKRQIPIAGWDSVAEALSTVGLLFNRCSDADGGSDHAGPRGVSAAVSAVFVFALSVFLRVLWCFFVSTAAGLAVQSVCCPVIAIPSSRSGRAPGARRTQLPGCQIINRGILGDLTYH